MKTRLDLPSDLDPQSPEFISTLNDRLRRMGDYVATVEKKTTRAARRIEEEAPVDSLRPNAPTAPAISVTPYADDPVNYVVHMEWTAPAPPEGAIAYEREFKYYNDEDLTIEDHEGWISRLQNLGLESTAADTDSIPRATYDQWVMGRVRAYNAANVPSDWAYTTEAAYIERRHEVTDPEQPGVADFTVAVTQVGPDPQTGEDMALIEATVTNVAEEAKYLSLWIYNGTAAPADLSLWVSAWDALKSSTGTTKLYKWVSAPVGASTKYQCTVTASGAGHVWPTASSVVKEVTIEPAHAPQLATGFNVTATYSFPSGVHHGRLTVAFDPVPGDIYFKFWNVERRRMTAGYAAPWPGAEGVFEHLFGATAPFTQDTPWPVEKEQRWYEFRARAEGANGMQSAWSSIVQLSTPASQGIETGDGLTKTGTTIKVNPNPSYMSFDGTGKLIVNYDPNDFDFIYGYLRAKRIDLSKAANFDTTEFQIDPADFKLKQKVVIADKIAAGTMRVGYTQAVGGTAKPGQLGVFGNNGANAEVMVGWIGQNGIYAGGWFKQLYIGGSGPSTAKLVADASGNVSITNAAITITAGTSQVQMDPTYGLQVSNSGSGSVASLLSGNLTVTVGSYAGTYAATFASIGGSGTLFEAQAGRLDLSYAYGVDITARALGAVSSYITSRNYQISGTVVIDYNRVLQNVTLHSSIVSALQTTFDSRYSLTSHTHTSFASGLSVSGGYIEANASFGFRVGADIGLGVGSSYSLPITTPAGTKTLWVRGGLLFNVTG